jgi:hypothetical protein
MKNTAVFRPGAALRAWLAVALLSGAISNPPHVFAQRGGGSRPAPGPAASAENGTVGLALKDAATRGGQQVEVVAVVPGSPAAAAGFKPGDVILSVMSQKATSAEAARAQIQSWLAGPARAGGRPLPFIVQRGRANVALQIAATAGAERPAPAANDRLARLRNARRAAIVASTAGAAPAAAASGDVADPFLIPGFATRTATPGGLNVLQRVFLDPHTGELVFAGHHDPAYATGAIDYSTLLSDALRSPTPSFSLEPTADSQTASAAFIRQFDQQMNSNLRNVETGKAWMIGLFDQLLTNPALEVDRRRFLARGAQIFRVPPSEVPPFMHAMLGRTEMGSPPWINFWVKVYQHLGAPEAAEYIRAAANQNADPGSFQAALDHLGLRPIIEDLRARMQSGALGEQIAYARLEVAIWAAIYERCRVPESRWRAAADRASATGNTVPFRGVIDAINTEMVSEKVMDAWLNGLVLSETFLQVMHRMPPLEVAPVCADGLSPDSELARTFLAADWILKNLGVTPELVERVPGHRTPSQFSFELETARGIYDVGDVRARMWLEPATVELRHDSAGAVVDFGRARVAVRGSVIAHGRAGSAAGEQLARDAVDGYTRDLTRRYDEYARALPDLHRLREAAKIIALANWAQARRIKLVPPGPVAAPAPLPASFQRGFWTGNFHANPEKTFFGLVAIGGVDFGPQVGTGWVQTQEDPALGHRALKQLVASSALGQEAVKAAVEDGDLEKARLLAEQSAQAMTGAIDFTGHPALGQIPEVPPPTSVTEIELQTEALTLARQSIAELGRTQPALQQPGADEPRTQLEAQRAQAEERLRKLQALLAAEAREPAQARHYVKLLRNGDWDSLPAPPPRQTVAAAPAPPPAAPARVEVDPVERARLRDEITQLRTELCRVQVQLRRFNATIQMDQGQRDEWEKRVNDAYESALDRAKEKLADFSVDFPEEKLNERLEKLTDPAERAKVERALRMVQHLKEAYKVKDFAKWAEHEEYSRAEVIEGIQIIADVFEVEDKIKDYLSKRWGLKRVIAFQEAASDLVTSAFDVTSEVVSWRRLNQLNRNSEDFLRAVEATAQRQRAVMDGIRQREISLGLDPGSTKEPCEP